MAIAIICLVERCCEENQTNKYYGKAENKTKTQPGIFQLHFAQEHNFSFSSSTASPQEALLSMLWMGEVQCEGLCTIWTQVLCTVVVMGVTEPPQHITRDTADICSQTKKPIYLFLNICRFRPKEKNPTPHEGLGLTLAMQGSSLAVYKPCLVT